MFWRIFSVGSRFRQYSDVLTLAHCGFLLDDPQLETFQKVQR